jgi:hypothetical protein
MMSWDGQVGRGGNPVVDDRIGDVDLGDRTLRSHMTWAPTPSGSHQKMLQYTSIGGQRPSRSGTVRPNIQDAIRGGLKH